MVHICTKCLSAIPIGCIDLLKICHSFPTQTHKIDFLHYLPVIVSAPTNRIMLVYRYRCTNVYTRKRKSKHFTEKSIAIQHFDRSTELSSFISNFSNVHQQSCNITPDATSAKWIYVNFWYLKKDSIFLSFFFKESKKKT